MGKSSSYDLKPRNHYARDLHTEKFRKRIVEDKTKYNRKRQPNGRQMAE